MQNSAPLGVFLGVFRPYQSKDRKTRPRLQKNRMSLTVPIRTPIWARTGSWSRKPGGICKLDCRGSRRVCPLETVVSHQSPVCRPHPTLQTSALPPPPRSLARARGRKWPSPQTGCRATVPGEPRLVSPRMWVACPQVPTISSGTSSYAPRTAKPSPRPLVWPSATSSGR